MNRGALPSARDTEELFKWPSYSAAVTRTQAKQWHVGAEAAPAGPSLARALSWYRFVLVNATLAEPTENQWSPLANIRAIVFPAESTTGERCYEVEISARGGKFADFVPNDLITYSQATLQYVDPFQCEDIGNEITIEQVEQHFQMRDADEVRSFLRENPEVTQIILDSLEPLTRIFVEIEQLVLEVFRDPEEQGNCELVCSIVTRLTAEEALEKLDMFDEQWFLDNTERTHGLLNFRIDFV